MQSLKENPEEVLARGIKSFVLTNPDNRMERLDNRPFFEEPLVGSADARDPLFEQFKDESVIGSLHLTPLEMMEQSLAEHK